MTVSETGGCADYNAGVTVPLAKCRQKRKIVIERITYLHEGWVPNVAARDRPDATCEAAVP
jgi:hypothetical protein